MNAQQEAVALYRYLEGRGFTPSVRSIGRALRDQHVEFRETSLRGWLEPFVKPRDASQTQADATGTHETRTADATGTQADATGTRLRAHDKVSLPSKPDTSYPALPLLEASPAENPPAENPPATPSPSQPLPEPAPEPQPAPKARKARRQPSPADLAAYSLLDALQERIGVPEGITVRDWRSRNVNVVRSMLASGVPAESWLAFWDDAAAAGFTYRSLRNMQEGYGKRRGREMDRPENENESSRLPTVADLIREGVVDGEAMDAEVLAGRPAWFTPPQGGLAPQGAIA